ncbi:MAG: hypothetical protein RMJ48_08510 [Roseiflexaceae bacterium]|nr:hypothetical protein [Roseiflexaceae bacterium]
MSFFSQQFADRQRTAASPAGATAGVAVPPEPTSIEETGLSMGFLNDLVLKVIYFHGNITGQQIAEVTKLPFFGVLDKVLEFLKLEEYVDIVGAQGGFNERSFQYVVATKGRSESPRGAGSFTVRRTGACSS